MNKADAIDRDINRDPIRAIAYEEAVEECRADALVLLPERYLPVAYEAVRKFRTYRLGPTATRDAKKLLELLREELREEQKEALDQIKEQDEAYYREYWEATE